MKHALYLILFFNLFGFGQTSISAKLVTSTPFEWDTFVGIDSFESVYFLKSNVLFKKNSQGLQNYSNLDKGVISKVSVFNALKLALFYKDFNSVTLLDNRLADLITVDFNALSPLRTLSHISNGNDTTFWLFDSNALQLELFDYNSSKIRVRAATFQNEILALDSDYNTCWVLTEKEVQCYNYMGSLISRLPHEGFTDLKLWNGILFLMKNNTIYYKQKTSDAFLMLNLPKVLVKQFFVTNQTLYIYDEEFLHHYQLINN
jgi:hypothetical protein